MQQMMLDHITTLLDCAPRDVLEQQVQDVEYAMTTTLPRGDAAAAVAAPNANTYFPPNQGYVYVLKLEGDASAESYFYVGFTQNLARRLGEHFQGHGAEWTKLHLPHGVAEVARGERDDERTKTLEYMRKHGWARTRGHCWTSRILRSPPKELDE
jgi:predicted GIY-YIG superfamily endonuclease